MPKRTGEFRVALVGGSTVVNGDPPIARLLEREFNESGYLGVRVYNFGVLASVSGMDVARLVFEVGDLEPQLIIMYNGGNDIASPFFFDRASRSMSSRCVARFSLALSRKEPRGRCISWT